MSCTSVRLMVRDPCWKTPTTDMSFMDSRMRKQKDFRSRAE
jgi:hypothetical protein